MSKCIPIGILALLSPRGNRLSYFDAEIVNSWNIENVDNKSFMMSAFPFNSRFQWHINNNYHGQWEAAKQWYNDYYQFKTKLAKHRIQYAFAISLMPQLMAPNGDQTATQSINNPSINCDVLNFHKTPRKTSFTNAF